MPEDESKSGAFFKWLGGIVATVASAVLIYYLVPKSPATVTTIPPVGLSGVVADATTHQLLRGANVTVSLGGQSVQQTTDPNGAFSVVLPGIGTTEAMGLVSGEAAGYTTSTNSVPLKPSDDNYAQILLQSISPPAAQPPVVTGGPVLVGTLHPGIVIMTPPPHFIKPPAKYAIKPGN